MALVVAKLLKKKQFQACDSTEQFGALISGPDSLDFKQTAK